MTDPAQPKRDASPESKPHPESPGAHLPEGATRKIRGAPAGEAGGDESEHEEMRMPFEQDQSSDSSADQPHEKMRQAKKDLDAGLVDTDLRNTPGQDAERQRELLDREKARSGNSAAAERGNGSP